MEELIQPRIQLGTAIHDLKTHLTAIIASADLLSETLQPFSNDTIAKLVQAIIRNARTMDEKLSDIAQLHGNFDGSQAQGERTSVNALIHEAVSLLTPLIQLRKQILTQYIPEDLSPVSVNPRYAQFVMLTLLHNASKYTPPNGELKVSARNGDGDVVIEVRDSGIGIPREEWDSIFQPRRRLIDQSGPGAGSGIGLAMARFLLELHGGRLWLESEVGKGSCFYFTLPAADSKRK